MYVEDVCTSLHTGKLTTGECRKLTCNDLSASGHFGSRNISCSNVILKQLGLCFASLFVEVLCFVFATILVLLSLYTQSRSCVLVCQHFVVGISPSGWGHMVMSDRSTWSKENSCRRQLAKTAFLWRLQSNEHLDAEKVSEVQNTAANNTVTFLTDRPWSVRQERTRKKCATNKHRKNESRNWKSYFSQRQKNTASLPSDTELTKRASRKVVAVKKGTVQARTPLDRASEKRSVKREQ